MPKSMESPGVTVSSRTRHLLLCLSLVAWLATFFYLTGALQQHQDLPDPWLAYGTLGCTFLIFIRLLSFLGLPQTLFNLVGLVKFDAFQTKVTLNSTPLLAPFVCVRVVTRGLYPKLVRETVKKNAETLAQVGMENYVIQVVTDTAVNAASDGNRRVRELVVPSSYRTKSGALNKSRALQYCLEEDVNFLGDDDWIVHLDEETLLTKRSVKGILNFIAEGRHDFGQGLITYASNPVQFRSWSKFLQNRICTVADSFRVADDMGKLRCQFKIFHKPLFGWKGSFVVTRAGAERRVTFDNGPEGSKAEDCFFAMSAMDLGYSFDFIEGEMLEKSPFTFSDFFKQRKRWMQGIFMVVMSPLIRRQTKTLLAISLASWLTIPLTVLNMVLCHMFPMTLGPVVDLGLAFLGGMGLFMYGFGYIKQHPVHRYSWLRLLVVLPEIILSSALSIVVENFAVCTMWFGDWYDFYIVEKEAEGEDGNNNDKNKKQLQEKLLLQTV